MFFESALKGKNQWWRYLVLFIAAFLAAMTIGNLPLIIVMMVATMKDPTIIDSTPDNMMDLSAFGVSPNLALILVVVPFIVGLIAFALLIKPLNNRSYKTVINGTGSIRWKRVFFSFGLWFLLFGVYLIINLKLDPNNFSLNNTDISLLVLALVSLLFVPLQTTFEEVLFRGYLMQGFGLAFRNKWAPLIITSVIFGLLHSINPEIKEFGFLTMMPQYITFGLVFGLITILDDGIELAVGAHAANNVFLSIFLTQDSSTLQTPAMYEQINVYPWSDFISMLLVSFVFIFLLGLTYKWSFKESFSKKF